VALEQSAYINLQRTGELHYIFHPYVSFAAFDPADISRMQARSIGFSAYFMKSRTTHGRQHRQARKTNAQGQLFRGRIRSHRYKEGMERQYKHRKITGTHEESKSFRVS